MHRRPGGLAGLTGADQERLVAQLQLQYQRELLKREEAEFEPVHAQNGDPDRDFAAPDALEKENTDDSGMGTEMEAEDERKIGRNQKHWEEAIGRKDQMKDESPERFSDDTDQDTTDDDDEDDGDEATFNTGSRRTSQVGFDRQRRPSYTCYHGPLLPRGAPRVGRRAKPRPLRDLDVLQLAAGATVMLAPVTPELLR